jgi:hypothetical protein
MDTMVYVAGAYSNADPIEVEENVSRALDVGDAIEDAGLRAFIPHLSHFRHVRRARGYQEWMDIDRAWLSKCDALFRMEGPSKGADLEVLEAERLGIPVFHDLWSLLVWVRNEREG